MLLNKIILKSIPILILFGFLSSTTRDRPDDFNYNQSTLQAFYFFEVASIDEISLDENDWVAAVSSIGRLLMFPISELTVLPKGKGLKIIQIPPAKLKTREEYVVAITAMGEIDNLIVYTSKRYTVLKTNEQEKFIGERGRRGSMLSRNFRNVIRISSEVG